MKPPALARDLVPVNELRSNLSTWLARVGDGRSVVVTQRGRAAAVLVAPEVLDEAEAEREFMRAVVVGLRDVEAGRLVDDDAVWSEMDALMAGDDAGVGPVD